MYDAIAILAVWSQKVGNDSGPYATLEHDGQP